MDEALAQATDSVVVAMNTIGKGGFQTAVAAAQNSKLGNGGASHRSAGGEGRWVEHGHHALMRVAAFRAVGWGAKEEAFKTYLMGLGSTYRFHLLDYTAIASFHGTRNAFYDGAHVTAANARRILRQAVEDAPAAFR